MNAESVSREREIDALLNSNASKSFVALSAVAMADMAKMESFLDIEECQSQTYVSDCEFFGFNHKYPRVPSNSPIFQFKSWQVTGMRQMIRILDNPNAKACLLADAIEARPVQSQARAETHTDEDDQELGPNENPFIIPDLPIRPPPAKPILLIVQPELIEQLAAEIQEASQYFKVLIYHGDERSSWFGMYEKAVAKSTTGNFTRDHPILTEMNATLALSHGPSALKNYRMHHLKYTQQDADDLITVNDPKWAYNLEGLLDHVTVDEAHILKNCDTMAHKTVA
ncbi:hypothetical protein BPAE_0228g00060 [Botrytis paeoniae]|uniref:SNF2 N-terminal domain-containing protein n=1 Tax=Botrytis paeoniae TaxID=278948 RepID=A0A4Z1FET7_9HELO|nr:hypothetical protein BPAE_0228g00060 [Botrytis paeoniae]